MQTINDWYDKEIDAINEPYRPIPSGAISEPEVSPLQSDQYCKGHNPQQRSVAVRIIPNGEILSVLKAVDF